MKSVIVMTLWRELNMTIINTACTTILRNDCYFIWSTCEEYSYCAIDNYEALCFPLCLFDEFVEWIFTEVYYVTTIFMIYANALSLLERKYYTMFLLLLSIIWVAISMM